MNGVFFSLEGDLRQETNAFARASVMPTAHRADEIAELEAAALAQRAVRRDSVAGSFSMFVEGAQSSNLSSRSSVVRLSMLHRPSMRGKLLHAMSRKGKAEHDHEDDTLAQLAQVRQRFDNAGVPMQDVLVRFKNLSVTGLATVKPGMKASAPPKPGVKGALQRVASVKPGARKSRAHILENVSSVLHPGRFTLLLGPPGAGKTTLMRALSGLLKRESKLKVTADELTYNGKSFKEFVVERTAAYINQNDIHFAELTVRETLDFSALCQTSRTRKPAEVLLEEREKELGIKPDPNTATYMTALGEHHHLATDITIKALGLEGCADTLVGGAMIRGISGGQRKRVTSGEMLVGPSNVLFADEISTGLDSATTFEICTRLRAVCHITKGTVLVSLLQPTPETFELYDDIMLLSGGRLVFHGPRESILPFFETLGFECPVEKGAADFLQEVTTLGDQRLYWSGKNGEYAYVSDRAVEKAYRATEYGADFLTELELTAAEEKEGHCELAVHKYGQGPWTLFKANMARQTKLFLRNRAFIGIRIGQCVIMGFAVGTLFLQQGRNSLQNAQMYMSVAFFSVMTQLVVSFAAPGLLIERLPVYYRQRNAHMYPGWCFALPELLLQAPLIATEAAIWTLMVYFMIGFVTSARILIFWCVMFFAGTCGLSLFMLLALFAKTITVAAALQNLCILIFTVSSGFIVSPANLGGGWLGAYYANPVTYLLQALVVNEFESENWDGPPPAGSPAGVTTAGQAYLMARGFHTGSQWILLGIVVWGVGSTLLNMFLFSVAASYLQQDGEGEVVLKPSEDELEDQSNKSAKQLDVPVGASTRGRRSAGDVEQAGGEASGQTSMPFTPVRMTFQDVKYSVPLPSGYKSTVVADGNPHAGRLLLLKGISGSFRPGVLTALMGSSGAGKTTLMDVLALRKTGGLITGDIRVNSFPQRPDTFMRVMGYVEQTDVHMPEATVHEALLFSARLRLPKTVPSAQAGKFVEEVMEVVELTELRDSTIGMPGQSGLSVEQRKRLTIAVELVANPSIVFMDEPTSGLDARAAAIVMRAVRRITDGGRTVVCTIHQPSNDIFAAFDELLLLKRGGQTVFHGALGPGAHKLVEYFTALKGVTPMKPGANPSTWMLDVTTPAVEQSSGGDFADHYALSRLYDQNEELIACNAQPKEGEADLRLEDLAAASALVQTKELLRRNFQQYARLWRSYTGARMLITIIIAFFFGTVLKGQGEDTYTYNGILNITGVQYSSVMFLGILNAMMVQSLISLRRTVFYRERAGGTYVVLPYSASEFLVEAPYLVVQAFFYSIILYWMVGFQANAGKFFWFLAVMILTLSYWTYFGLCAVQITPSLQIANAFTSFMFGVWDLFCGFYKPRPIIPKGWIWLYWMDPVSYTLYGLIVGELGDRDDPMRDQSPPVSVSQFVNTYFGYQSSFMGYTALILASFSMAFFLLATLALKKIQWQNR